MTVTPLSTAPPVLIRAARGSDGAALERLAGLDSAHVPAGDLLVAEADDGRIVATVSLESGTAIADPFRPTADVVDLLALRADRLRGPRRGVADRLALRPAPRARTA